METLGQSELWSFLDNQREAQRIGNITQVRSDPGHLVSSYLELATKIAELQFRNREHVLMFRGQSGDYLNRNGNTTLKPSLFRSVGGGVMPPGGDVLDERFRLLTNAERELVHRYQSAELLGGAQLARRRILRWSIIQHYEVCPTPLLDVTHSLRIAASFASQGESEEAFLFVLAVPNVSGAITASAEAGLQIVRLASVCPPTAVRPHVQEGYLLGEYPEMGDYDQKQLYEAYEIDFGRRLLAKFRFCPATFWRSRGFPRVGKRALYPSRHKDPLCDLAKRVREDIG